MINYNALKCISCSDEFKYIVTCKYYGDKIKLKEYNSDEVDTYHVFYIQGISPLPVFRNNKITNSFGLSLWRTYFGNDNGLYVYTNNDNIPLSDTVIFEYLMDCDIDILNVSDTYFSIRSICGNIIEQNQVRRNMDSIINRLSRSKTYNFCKPIRYPSFKYDPYDFGCIPY